jgi:opacity protein-like surface antigen
MKTRGKMKSKVSLGVAAAWATLSASPAMAQLPQDATPTAPAPTPSQPEGSPFDLGEQPGPDHVWPMKWDIGLGLGFNVFSEHTGLGNGSYFDDQGRPVTVRSAPESSGAIALRGTAWVLDQLGVELEGKVVPTQIAPASAGMAATVFGARAAAIYQFLHEGEWRPFALAGAGMEIFRASKSLAEQQAAGVGTLSPDIDAAFMLGGGVKWQATHDISVRLDLRWLTSKGVCDKLQADGATCAEDADRHTITGNYEGLLTVGYTLGGKPDDEDKDGLLDPWDKCPTQAEDKDGFEDKDGCPDGDNDKDGIADEEDKCPNVAEDKDNFEDYDGCPDGDNDKDGVQDGQDKCPNEPETKNGWQDEDGCPDTLVDTDKDGVPDPLDKCPREAGPKSNNGCPVVLDKDKDGLLDKDDQCPDQPETKNGWDDGDGCPDEFPAEVQKLVTTEKLTGLAWQKDGKLDEKKSAAALQPIGDLLKQYPRMKLALKLVSEEVDQAAASQRVAAVKAFLVARGATDAQIVATAESKKVAPPAPDPAAKPQKPAKAPPAAADYLVATLAP